MKRKIAGLTMGLLILSLAAGLLWAQEEPERPAIVQYSPGHVARAMQFNFTMGGQPRLGVAIADVDAEQVKELKLPGEFGAVVKDVEDDSPAKKAGLAMNDVILEFAGERVRSAAQLQRLVRETPPGRNVTLMVSRAGQSRDVTLKLEEPERHYSFAPRIGVAPAIPATPVLPDLDVFVRHRVRLGISGDELTGQLADYFGVKQGKGVLVREVVVGSAADKAGLKAGDVIVAVGDKEVASVSKLRRALTVDPDEKRTFKLTIVRDRKEMTLTAELEPAKPPSPRQITENFVLGSPEEMQAFAEQMREQSEVIREEARKAAEEWKKQQGRLQEEQKRLQEEMERLEEERFELNDRIKNKIRIEMGRIEQQV